MSRKKSGLVRIVCILMTLTCLLPLQSYAAVDPGVLQDALPEDAQTVLDHVTPENVDLKGGLTGLWNRAKEILGDYIRQAMGIGILMLGACLVLALAVGFSGDAGLQLPERSIDFTAVAILLTIYFSTGNGLIHECTQAISRLDGFIQVMTPVYAVVSAMAGHPVSAVAVGEITLLFSAVVSWLSRYIILPGISLYVLMDAVGGLLSVGLLGKLAELLRWAIGKGMKWILTGFTAYHTLSGIITRSTDTFAIKTAQSAISSLIPVVGSLISGTSDALLGGANLLRASVGIYGLLSVCAICLGPIVRAAAHFLVFKVLSTCASAYLGGAASRTLHAITEGYGMAVAALAMCCTVEFISIVVSAVVTAS